MHSNGVFKRLYKGGGAKPTVEEFQGGEATVGRIPPPPCTQHNNYVYKYVAPTFLETDLYPCLCCAHSWASFSPVSYNY